MKPFNFMDISAQRFGALLVLEYVGYRPGGGAWRCRCDCGNEPIVRSAQLRLGYARSCGCKRYELGAETRKSKGTHTKPLEDQYIPITESGCWIFLGGINDSGYGVMTGNVLAHRFFYHTFVGPIPPGKWVLHRCDVRSCVNPNHLYLGTVIENVADAVARDRLAKGERGGNSRLNAAQARAIFKADGLHRQIARQFDVSRSTVTAIKKLRIWKHLNA